MNRINTEHKTPNRSAALQRWWEEHKMNRFNGPAVQNKTNPQKMGTEMACSHAKVNWPSATPSSLSTTNHRSKKNPKVTGCCEKAVHLQSKVIIWMTLSGLKIADAIRTTLPVRLSVNSAMRSNQNKNQKISHRGFRLVIYGYCRKLLFTKFKTLNKIMLPSEGPPLPLMVLEGIPKEEEREHAVS